MQTLTSCPVEIEYKRNYLGKYGTIHEFAIEMEDGNSGIFTTTKEQQDKFAVGKEVAYTLEAKTSSYGNYNKIDIVKEKFTGGKGTYKASGNDKEKDASILASVCLDMANVALVRMNLEEKVQPDLKAIHGLANKFYDYIATKAGTNTQLRINYQSRLKEVCNHFYDYPNLDMSTSDKLLAFVDMQVEYLKSKM